jgi:hypothetical protein
MFRVITSVTARRTSDLLDETFSFLVVWGEIMGSNDGNNRTMASHDSIVITSNVSLEFQMEKLIEDATSPPTVRGKNHAPPARVCPICEAFVKGDPPTCSCADEEFAQKLHEDMDQNLVTSKSLPASVLIEMAMELQRKLGGQPMISKAGFVEFLKRITCTVPTSDVKHQEYLMGPKNKGNVTSGDTVTTRMRRPVLVDLSKLGRYEVVGEDAVGDALDTQLSKDSGFPEEVDSDAGTPAKTNSTRTMRKRKMDTDHEETRRRRSCTTTQRELTTQEADEAFRTGTSDLVVVRASDAIPVGEERRNGVFAKANIKKDSFICGYQSTLGYFPVNDENAYDRLFSKHVAEEHHEYAKLYTMELDIPGKENQLCIAKPDPDCNNTKDVGHLINCTPHDECVNVYMRASYKTEKIGRKTKETFRGMMFHAKDDIPVGTELCYNYNKGRKKGHPCYAVNIENYTCPLNPLGKCLRGVKPL